MGHTWLRKHNPEINWTTGEVKMSRCSGSCCSGCRDEIRAERKAKKAEVCRLELCSAGDLPDLVRDDEDDEDDEDDLDFEDGDCMFASGLRTPPEEIRAMSTISQQLAEAFKWNSDQSGGPADTSRPAESIPD